VASGRTADMLEGAQLAASSIDSGQALGKLDSLISFMRSV
jgi:anthranilate phosphoribosyltransferase